MPSSCRMLLLVAALLCAPATAAALRTAECDVSADCQCPNDGRSDGTACIRACVLKCHQQGPDGATLHFASGVFLTGAFNVTSNMTLHIAEGATLLAATSPDAFPVVPALPSYGVCRDDGYPDAHAPYRHQAFISGWNVSNVRIIGNGTIDGQGAPWWEAHAKRQLDYGRPRLIELLFCRDLFIQGLRLHNSPFWTVHPYSCDNVYAGDLDIYAPDSAPNTDGIDPDSTKNVLIERCTIQVGDDAIAIKSGIDYAGRQFNRSTENVLIRDSWFKARHVAIGSEESGGVRNVTIINCLMGGPGYAGGIHLKSERGRGGYIKNVTFQDITIVNLTVGMDIDMFYSDSRPPTNKTATPVYDYLYFTNITGINVSSPGQFRGLPESPMDHVFLTDVHFDPKSAWKCTAVANLQQSDTVPQVKC